MAKCSDHKTPLQHGGTSQAQRLPAGLQAGYVQVDEKDFADWIVFAQRFGAYLQYYSLNNQPSGNWQAFFSNDISAVLGTVAIQNAEQYKTAISDRLRQLQGATENTTGLDTLKAALGDLFSALFSFAKAVDLLLQKLPAGMLLPNEKELPLRQMVENLVQLRLRPALAQTIHYYKAGQNLGLVKEEANSGWLILNKEVEKATAVIASGLAERWREPHGASWEDYYNSINTSGADTSVFGTAAEDEKKLAHFANHNLFKSVLDEFLSAFSKIVAEGEKQLMQTLEAWDTHPAHYTLFLSFLKLFTTSRDHLNTLTHRHLDFYYKDVLRLKQKPAAPDSAHVLITLTKQAQAQQLSKGTLFRGGKDSAGNEVFYALDRDEVFNKATVEKLMAWYRGSAADDTAGITQAQRMFAAPVINSEDGLGKELKTAFKEWHPFMVRNKTTGALAMPKAEVGFAIASHYLLLAEGDRRIKIKVAGIDDAANTLIKALKVDCYLTTEKGWHKVSNLQWTDGSLSATEAVLLDFLLEGDVPPITAYNAGVHGGTYNVQVPLARIVLRNLDSEPFVYYADLAKVAITRIGLEVQVGQHEAGTATNDKGLKNLLLSSDTGIIDASKPFRPFGPFPQKGASLFIGNQELFSKKGAAFTVNITWANRPAETGNIAFDLAALAISKADYFSYISGTEKIGKGTSAIVDNTYPDATFSFLQKGSFGSGTSVDILAGDKVSLPAQPAVVPEGSLVPHNTPLTSYDVSAIGGFFKLVLKGDFGHAAYQQALTTYLIEKANKTQDPQYDTQPVEPYTPTIQSITISYTASVVMNLTDMAASEDSRRALQFFHLYPFGEAEQHAAISNSSTVYLLPQFVHVDEDAKPVLHQGEFYIGLKDLQPSQSVNLLVQVLEGTADPQVDKPDKHVHWSYLSNNRWLTFKDEEYDDATNQLIQSGILSFILPENVTTNNTVLPAGFTWLRAAIHEKPEAIAKILSISAQAARVTLQLNGVAPDFLKTPLPAGTISKLKSPVASIKKIEQPFASFGGRLEEEAPMFYVRVSERLRHKSRAITIWDYERLVLEAFPQIHKVKCLNHTRIEDDLYNEVAPGYVSIVTIPKTVHRNDVNPLKPYTSQDLLVEIEKYLRTKTSCHVTVQARQPLFEEVKLKFLLKLYEGYEFGYYSNLLKEEITRFLSPWAYEGEQGLHFGGKVHKSVLINFIEEQPYVDYISDVILFRREGTIDKDAKDEVEASTARSILVSVPAAVHEILPVSPTDVHPINEICKECGKA